MKIIHNRIRCAVCGAVIESKHTHDLVECNCYKDGNKENSIYVDGGKDYLRRGGKLENIIDLSVVSHDLICQKDFIPNGQTLLIKDNVYTVISDGAQPEERIVLDGETPIVTLSLEQFREYFCPFIEAKAYSRSKY